MVGGLRVEDAGGSRQSMGSCVRTENNHDVYKESHGAGAIWLGSIVWHMGAGLGRKGVVGEPKGIE